MWWHISTLQLLKKKTHLCRLPEAAWGPISNPPLAGVVVHLLCEPLWPVSINMSSFGTLCSWSNGLLSTIKRTRVTTRRAPKNPKKKKGRARLRRLKRLMKSLIAGIRSFISFKCRGDKKNKKSPCQRWITVLHPQTPIGHVQKRRRPPAQLGTTENSCFTTWFYWPVAKIQQLQGLSQF